MQRAEGAAHELDDGVVDGGEHAAHDAVAAGVQRELDHAVPAHGVAEHPRRVGRDGAVVELDPLFETTQHGRGDAAAHLGDVRLLDAEARVGEHVGELAVVREQQQSARLGVEPAHVVEALVEAVGVAA